MTVTLSPVQQRIWSLQQMFPENPIFNLARAWRVAGEIDEAAFVRAFARLVARHDVLRTRLIVTDSGEVEQHVLNAPSGLSVEDMGEAVGKAELTAYLDTLRAAPFQVEGGELYRAKLLRISKTDRIFFFAPHNIIWDEQSWAVFLSDLSDCYKVEVGQGVGLERSDARQYRDYVIDQQSRAESDAAQVDISFWRDYLDGEHDTLALPSVKRRPKLFSYKGAGIPIDLSEGDASALRALAAENNCAPFAVCLSAWRGFLARISGQRDIVIGASIDGRYSQSDKDLVGCFADMAALRSVVSQEESFSSLISKTIAAFDHVAAHRAAPFEVLMAETKNARDLSRTPVFQTMASYFDRSTEVLSLGEARIGAFPLSPFQALTDLSLIIDDFGDDMRMGLTYAADVFTKDDARNLASCFEAFLGNALRRPEALIAELAIMAPTERARLCDIVNDTEAAFSENHLATEYFDEMALAAPGAVAVSMDGDAISYDVLMRRANRIANHLRAQGIVEGDIVALYHERSIDLIAAMFGIWKAGACLLPMDPFFPANRTAYIMSDAQVRAVVGRNFEDEAWRSDTRLEIDLAQDAAAIDKASEAAPAIDREKAHRRAYVIYTSGSSGAPKGVVNGHRQLCNFIEAMMRSPGLSASDRLLAVTTLSFDIMLLELVATLSAGGEVVLANDDDTSDAEAVAEIIAARDITVLQATPATWRLLTEMQWSGKKDLKALCGGEVMPASMAKALIPYVGELWNMYGPTETTVWSTCARIVDPDDINVGHPIANTQTYILDDSGEPVPVGIEGDLWIGGDGVSDGYLGRNDLTEERFRTNPFKDGNGRIYNTGDRARRRHDDAIEILGRCDDQVKIRGYRIELGEIETALARHSSVAAAAAALRQDTAGEPILVAYMVFKDGSSATVSEARRFLRDQLPAYMVPQFITPLDALPLTANNKVDRKALPAPMGIASAVERVKPRTSTESGLAAIWKDILQVNDISITDNFFDLGGQSLAAARMIARARGDLGLAMTARDVIFSTLEQLAKEEAAA